MSDYSESNDFQDILDRLLSNVDDSLDKRQGSIIYDALAPAAAELAQCYIALDVYTDQTYLLTAVGDNLDRKVADYGLTRNAATYSEMLVEIYDTTNSLMDIDIGSRFSVPNEYGGYNFNIITRQEKGKYIAVCETAGTVGNEYIGELLPLQSINNLGTTIITEIYKPGEDIENDDDLRKRTLSKLQQTAFGGNIASYKQYTEDIEGVGQCLVIPVWNGGGTVKLVIVDSNYTIPNSGFINEIQTIIDPVQNSGKGYGIAPIGHKVTVVAPTKFNINISFDININTNYDLSNVQNNVKIAIENYIKEIQKDWGLGKAITIYISRITVAVLSVEGIDNVENISINDKNDNLIINPLDSNNPYPVLNEVIINENQ